VTDSKPPAGESPWALITRRAIEDPDFRERLMEDPRSTIAEATGQDIPEDVEVVVVENGPKTFHIVLPSGDLDLEALSVAGGLCDGGCVPGGCVPAWDLGPLHG